MALPLIPCFICLKRHENQKSDDSSGFDVVLTDLGRLREHDENEQGRERESLEIRSDGTGSAPVPVRVDGSPGGKTVAGGRRVRAASCAVVRLVHVGKDFA